MSKQKESPILHAWISKSFDPNNRIEIYDENYNGKMVTKSQRYKENGSHYYKKNGDKFFYISIITKERNPDYLYDHIYLGEIVHNSDKWPDTK